jgi:hypothetical protein
MRNQSRMERAKMMVPARLRKVGEPVRGQFHYHGETGSAQQGLAEKPGEAQGNRRPKEIKEKEDKGFLESMPRPCGKHRGNHDEIYRKTG